MQFEGKTVCLDLTNSIQYKKKKQLIDTIAKHGGTISFILNKKVNYLVKEDAVNLDTYKCRNAFKLGIPVVNIDYINRLTQSIDSSPILINDYILKNKKNEQDLQKGFIPRNESTKKKPLERLVDLSTVKTYQLENDPLNNEFEQARFEIVKWIVFNEKSGPNSFIFEIHSQNKNGEKKYRFRLEKLTKKVETQVKSVQHVYASDAASIMFIFKQQMSSFLNEKLYVYEKVLPCPFVGSKMLQAVAWTSQAGKSIDKKTALFVDYIWDEAIGDLYEIFESGLQLAHFTAEKLLKAEGVLYKQGANLSIDMSSEFYNILPNHKASHIKPINNKRVLYEKLELCQLIRDMISINEATNWNLKVSTHSKYKAIGSFIKALDASSPQYSLLEKQIMEASGSVTILNIYEIIRPGESLTFNDQMHNQKQLFHGSKVNNFSGILSRGLLLPKTVVEEYGGTRSDIGLLGAGIYFSDCLDTSLKYSSSSTVKNSRLITVCDVALGDCKHFYEISTKLTKPVKGFNSSHGVRKTNEIESEFTDSEYVVYDVNQCRIRYVVEMICEEKDGPVKDIETNLTVDDLDENNKIDNKNKGNVIDFDLQKLEMGADALEKVDTGLVGESGCKIPLKSIHVRAQLNDMLSKVVIFQEYKNEENRLIEAKYLFPMDENAAVCGFEAFINDKHIIGICKEKQEAHRQYKKAIEKGHGAYLMDQETPELFKVNVGNLPAKCTCIIKITYVAELAFEGESIVFKLPSGVSPWQSLDVEKIHLQSCLITRFIDKLNGQNMSFKASINMPFKIKSIHSPTHKVKIKQTETTALVEMDFYKQSFHNGLVLEINIATVHMPRMIVEDLLLDSENNETRAVCVAFYPEFDQEPSQHPIINFCIDCSNSMATGSSFNDAKKLLILALHKMPPSAFFNVLAFGSEFTELFPIPFTNSVLNVTKAVEFINCLEPCMGNTNLLDMLRPSLILSVSGELVNFVLISDCHIAQHEEIVRLFNHKETQNRLFTLGVGPNPNNHLGKIVARCSAAAFDSFDSSRQSTWKNKVIDLMDKICQPDSIKNIEIEWQNLKPTDTDSTSFNNSVAPRHLSVLFAGRRVMAYGFIPNCQQAVLKAKVNGCELSTVVSCPVLNVTKGDILHKLTAKFLIEDMQYGVLCSNDEVSNELLRASLKKKIINLSCKYNITSIYTSFLAIEDRDNLPIHQHDTPNINSLIEFDNDAKAVEILTDMAYKTVESKIDSEWTQLLDVNLESQLNLSECEQFLTLADEICDRNSSYVYKSVKERLVRAKEYFLKLGLDSSNNINCDSDLSVERRVRQKSSTDEDLSDDCSEYSLEVYDLDCDSDLSVESGRLRSSKKRSLGLGDSESEFLYDLDCDSDLSVERNVRCKSSSNESSTYEDLELGLEFDNCSEYSGRLRSSKKRSLGLGDSESELSVERNVRRESSSNESSTDEDLGFGLFDDHIDGLVIDIQKEQSAKQQTNLQPQSSTKGSWYLDFSKLQLPTMSQQTGGFGSPNSQVNSSSSLFGAPAAAAALFGVAKPTTTSQPSKEKSLFGGDGSDFNFAKDFKGGDLSRDVVFGPGLINIQKEQDPTRRRQLSGVFVQLPPMSQQTGGFGLPKSTIKISKASLKPSVNSNLPPKSQHEKIKIINNNNDLAQFIQENINDNLHSLSAISNQSFQELFSSSCLDDEIYFSFNVKEIEHLLNVNLEAVSTYLNKSGLKSYCELTRSEIRSMVLGLLLVYICSITTATKPSKKLSTFDGVDQEQALVFADYCVPSDILNLNALVKFIVNKQRQYSIECSSLELARNWNSFMKTFLFKN